MSNEGDKTPQRKALGKGLSSLLSPRSATPVISVPSQSVANPTSFGSSEEIQVHGVAPATLATYPSQPQGPTLIPIDTIEPSPAQPRTVFQDEKLRELAASIQANGIIQPIVVRLHEGKYQLIAGERRWRAARIAGLTEVPVVVQNIDDAHLLEVALIENIQREDLNPIETAHAYQRLAHELNLSQEEIGKRTGKDRTSITNTLRLLKLPQQVQLLLAEHRLSMGHARAVLSLATPEEQIDVAEKAAAQGNSVRQVEALVKKRLTDPKDTETTEVKQDPNVKAAAEDLERALGTRVRIVEKNENRGRIEIEYYSQEELDRLFQYITSNK
jgi:ParB family chromosome partitioning protein